MPIQSGPLPDDLPPLPRRWLGVGAALVALYVVYLATDLGPAALKTILPAAAHALAGGLAIARWRTAGRGRLAFLLLGVGLLAYAAGTVAYGIGGELYPVGIPWSAHLGWGAFYVLTYLGMVTALAARLKPLAISFALDGLLGTLTLTAVGACALPFLDLDGISAADAAAGLAYPAADIVLMSMALGACAFGGWRNMGPWQAGAAAFALLLVGDVAVDVHALTDNFDDRSVVWAAYPAALLALGVLPWLVDERPLQAADGDSFGLVAVPVASFLVALGIHLVDGLVEVPPLAHVLSLLVLLLAAVRAAATYRDLGRLREARRFERGFRDAEIGMAIIGRDHTWVRVNDALCRMLGRPAGELVGADVGALVHPADPGEGEEARLAFAGDQPPRSRSYEMVLRRADGRPVEIFVTTARVPGEDGRPWYFCQAQDITERNRAQRHSAALADLGRLAIETSDPQALVRSAMRVVLAALPSQHCFLADEAALGASGLSAPVRRRACELQHLVAVRDPADGPFDGRDLRFLQGVGDVLAGALDRTEAERETRRQAVQDPLTGLPNRSALTRELDHALALSHDQARTVALVLLDLDRFKNVNDTLGHGAGDDLLRLVADRLLAETDAMDVVARLGGDEFVVVLPLVDGEDDALATAQRLVDALEAPFDLGGQELFVRASAGVALAHGPADSAESLVRDADVAMYHAKDAGGGRCALFDGALRDRVVRRLSIEHALQRAPERDELLLHYQPVVELATGRLAAFEALVRWQHPEHGLVPPGDFIPVAEDTGLIRPIGAWVLDHALADLAAWNRGRGDGEPLSLSVNISPRQLTPELPEAVGRELAAHRVAPGLLILEITESEVVGNAQQLAVVERLRALGCRVALDDFGTGFSSLASVTSLALDAVKLDRSLIAGLGTSDSADALVRAVVEMTRALGLRVVAEGLEDGRQLDTARALGCTYGQGWHVARPMDAEAAAALAAAPSAEQRALPAAA